MLDAPKGAVTPDLALRIRQEKEALLHLLDAVSRGDAMREGIPIVGREGGCPLGRTQERLWYLGTLAPESAVYNLPAAFVLRGTLDVPVLEAALAEIVRRHEVLRTSIVMLDDEPVQRIEADVELPVERHDLTSLPADDRLPTLHQWIDQAKDEPLDVGAAPMARAALFTVEPREHVLFWMPHHVIWDGWSFDIFLRELDVIYGAFAGGTSSPLPELPVQYADHAAWSRHATEGDGAADHLRFWSTQLDGTLPILDLPTDRPRPEIMSYAGARATLELPEGLSHALAALGRDEDATHFMVLLAGFFALLHRYTGQDDIIVGSPVQARVHADTQDLLGVFVNTLLLRARVRPDMTFRDLLRDVRRVCIETYDHQDTPFELLVEEFETERTLARTPLYQVLFSYQDVTNRGAFVGDLDVSQLHVETSVAPTDMTIWLMETGEGLIGGIDYATDLFDAATVDRFLDHYSELLRHAAEAPDTPVRLLGLMRPEEIAALAGESTGPAQALSDVGIHELVQRNAVATPDAVAVSDDAETLTYRELEERAGSVHARLATAGVEPGDLVGVHLERNAAMLPALLGVFKAGAAYVPLDPEFPPDRLAYMAGDAELRVVLSDMANQARFPGGDAQVLVLDDVSGADPPRPPESDGSTADRLAYVIYTSGSTGNPKGVEISHRSVINLLDASRSLLGFTAEDSLLAVTTLSFDISVLELFMPLLAGGRVVMGSPAQVRDGRSLAGAIADIEPTVVQATPASWRMLREAGWEGHTDLTALCGGEELPAGLAGWLRPRCLRLFNMYGPTETTIWSSAHAVEVGEDPVPIGRPLANTTFHVLDESGRVQPIGVAGELHIGGAGLARGYRNQPELTRSRFVPDPMEGPGTRVYRTGDLARRLADGTFEYLGRMDHQVKVRGFRVELGEIEAAMRALPEIAEAVAVVHEVREGDTRLAAFVVFEPGEDLEASDIRRALRRRLPPYMVPGMVTELDRLPLTPNGKIDRKALPDPLGGDSGDSRGFVEPQSESERLLAGIWRGLIGTERVGAHDNFFELGGHSLLSMKVVSAVERATGQRLDPRLMFFQTLRQIAAGLHESGAAAS